MVLQNQSSKIPSERAGILPYVGTLDINTRAMIQNWIDENISSAKDNRHRWIGRYPVAHAITLVLAKQLQSEDAPEDLGSLLPAAWAVQTSSEVALSRISSVDVDAECIRAFEHRLFEYSAESGIAGFSQWGLDAGSHQDGWDPYALLPSKIGRAHV